MSTLTADQIIRLKELASSKAWSDNEDFMVDDYAGGNVDDAFSGGERAGEILLARDILDELKISYEDPS